MSVFYIAAALLTGSALLFILPPLLAPAARRRAPARRSEANLAVLRDQLRELEADLAAGAIDAAAHADARRELLGRVAADVPPEAAGVAADLAAGNRWTALALGLMLPLTAMALYGLLGTPAALDPDATAAQADRAVDGQGHAVSDAELSAMTVRLAARLVTSPDDIDGWTMLARSYASLGQFTQAAAAYRNAVQRAPASADLLASFADVLAMSLGRTMRGEPERLIERALVLDPNNIKALSLSGSAAFERRDYEAAVTQWKKILLLVPVDSEDARDTMNSIGAAQARLAGRLAPRRRRFYTRFLNRFFSSR